MNTLNAVFDSRDRRYKNPVGAVRSGSKIMLSLLIPSSVKVVNAQTVVSDDRGGPHVHYTMTESVRYINTADYRVYTATIPMHERGLYWYHFEVYTDLGFHVISRQKSDNTAVNGRFGSYVFFSRTKWK